MINTWMYAAADEDKNDFNDDNELNANRNKHDNYNIIRSLIINHIMPFRVQISWLVPTVMKFGADASVHDSWRQIPRWFSDLMTANVKHCLSERILRGCSWMWQAVNESVWIFVLRYLQCMHGSWN